jgi:hypothetical protein
MPTTYKKLGGVQSASALTTYSDVYTVPSSTSTVISTISICNTSSANAKYRIGVASVTASPAAADWIAYDSTINGNDTTLITAGITMDTTYKFLVVSSNSTLVSFSAFGSEIS